MNLSGEDKQLLADLCVQHGVNKEKVLKLLETVYEFEFKDRWTGVYDALREMLKHFTGVIRNHGCVPRALFRKRRQRMHWKFSQILNVTLLAIVSSAFTQPFIVQAQIPPVTTITVTTTADTKDDGNSKTCLDEGPCTLRRAINQAYFLPSA